MQVSIARQLGLQPSTVGNFFMNARRRLHDKWQNSDYDNEVSDGSSNGTSMHTSAKLSETNNNSNTSSSSSSNAVTQGNTIMILDSGNCYSGTTELMHNQSQQPHDLSFALEAIESIEQPPQACSDSETEAAVVHAAAAAAASAAGVYSLTSL